MRDEELGKLPSLDQHRIIHFRHWMFQVQDIATDWKPDLQRRRDLTRDHPYNVFAYTVSSLPFDTRDLIRNPKFASWSTSLFHKLLISTVVTGSLDAHNYDEVAPYVHYTNQEFGRFVREDIGVAEEVRALQNWIKEQTFDVGTPSNGEISFKKAA